MTEETGLSGWCGLWLCLPRQPFGSAPSFWDTSLVLLSGSAAGSAGLAEGWKGASAPSARRVRQMFLCSAVPKNNSLVWERAFHLVGPGTEAASPSSINSSASSTNLRLCCWVVSALAGAGNLETDFYSEDEVSFPSRMDPDGISWPSVPQEEDASQLPGVGELSRLSSVGAAGCNKAENKNEKMSMLGVVLEGLLDRVGCIHGSCAGPSPTTAAPRQRWREMGEGLAVSGQPVGWSTASEGKPVLS